LSLDDWKKIAAITGKPGVHAFDIFQGWHGTREPTDQMCVPRGAFVYLAEGMIFVVFSQISLFLLSLMK